MRSFIASLLCLFCIFSIAFAAGELDTNAKRLEQVRKKIERAERSLKDKKKSELRISRELATLNQTVERIDARVAELGREQSALQQSIGEQQREVERGRNQVDAATGQLRKRLVALYKEGDSGVLKILFSSQSPTEMIQHYQYLTRISEHDQQVLADYRAVVAEQQQRLKALEDLEARKSSLLEQRKQERATAAEGRQLQQRLLRQARAEKSTLNRELSDLRQQAQRLSELLTKLREQEADEPVSGGALAKGSLPWPVAGRVIIGYGTQKDAALGTIYESNGIEIETPQGTAVKAVASGKVVFADYFKGYGNLVIINHPGNFHTLYARTDRLQKKVGERVAAGDLLGYSGLDGRDSVYFEIRANGSPVNPLTWLKKR